MTPVDRPQVVQVADPLKTFSGERTRPPEGQLSGEMHTLDALSISSEGRE